jgi:hypothetical protein
VHEKDEFDHVLYLQDASLDGRVSSYGGPSKIDGSTNLVRSQKAASSFVDGARALGIVAGDQLVHKTTLTGLLPNKDTFYDPSAKASGCSRCDVAGEPMWMDSQIPGLAAIAGLAWIIRRRNTVR